MQPTLRIQKPARPLLAVILTVSGAFLTLSLATYEPRDPSLNVAVSKVDTIHNAGGLIGSWLSDFLIHSFGLVAYGLALGLLFFGVGLFRSKTYLLQETVSARKSSWHLPVGLTLLLVFSSTLLSLLSWRIFGEIPLGGIIGYWVAQAGIFCFSTTGTTLVSAGALWASFILLSDRISLPAFFNPERFASGLNLVKERCAALISTWKKPTAEKTPSVHRGSELWGRKSVTDLKSVSNEKTHDEATPPKKAAAILPLFSRASSTPAENSDRVLLLDRAPKKEPTKRSAFDLPSLDCLDINVERHFEVSRDELIANSKTLEQKLLDFGVEGRVTNIHPGPIITLYEFEPAPGVKVKNVLNLTDDLKLALRSQSIRIIAPIPGRAAIGIEIPNPRRQTVLLRELLSSVLFQNSPSKLAMAMGKTTSGDAYIADLAKMPHLLIAGATGSGKSVGLNALVVSLLYKCNPDELKFIMIDPKMLELSVYEGIPHLLLPVVTDPKKAARALAWAVKEMERRYRLISSLGARNLKSYNDKVERLSADELKKELERTAKTEEAASAIVDVTDTDDAATEEAQKAALTEAGLDHYVQLPYIVIVIDELADLIMVAARDVEESIARLAQMARAAGIHLIIATQRPSVDVITGVIKANLPTRCAFQVASKVDSRTIIDTNGAENLIGEGDMLFLPPGTSRLERLHGPFISEDEIAKVVRFLKNQRTPDYSAEIDIEERPDAESEALEDFDDQLYDQALQVVFETRSPSASMLQRRLRVGYNRAARMIERMEREGIVSSPLAGGKGRELLVSSSAVDS